MVRIQFQTPDSTKKKLKVLAKQNGLDLGTYIRFRLTNIISEYEAQHGTIEENKKAE